MAVPLAGLWRRTVFHDSGGLASLVLQWLICQLARMSGVRIAALGVGVGDLRSATGRWLLRGIISRCELLLVRDEAAMRQCAGTKARLTDDLVFAWRSLPPDNGRRRPSAHPLCIGLTVSPVADEGTIAALSDAVRLWQKHDHRVVFLVFQHSAALADDTVFAAINRKVAAPAAIEIRRLSTDAPSIVNAFADIDIVCGMRFHSLVLAAMLGRPFVGIAHDNKISEICRRSACPATKPPFSTELASPPAPKAFGKRRLTSNCSTKAAGAQKRTSFPCVARDNVSRPSIWRPILGCSCIVRARVASRNDR